MYPKVKIQKSKLKKNTAVEGQTMEQKIAAIMNNKEPIKDGAPLIYTERKEGVPAGYNIKTDRFEIAVQAKDTVTKNILAKRDETPRLEIIKDNEGEETQSK